MSAALLFGFLLFFAAPLSAQTDTPTPTLTPTATPTCVPRIAPPSCAGAKKLNLLWFAKDPFTLRMAVSATQCPAIESCDLSVDGDLVSMPPPIVELRDASGNVFSKTITDPGFNRGGCPGSDLYRGASRLKFVFGTEGVTTVLGKMRFMQTQSGMPAFTPPLTVTISDACGVLYSATVSTCYPRVSETTAGLKCF
jgi:hypothetical protein